MKSLKERFGKKRTRKVSPSDSETQTNQAFSESASYSPDPVKRRSRRYLSPVLRNFLIGIVFVLAAVTFFNAVEASKPGDTLFVVEKEIEEIERMFLEDPADQAEFEIDVLDERYNELEGIESDMMEADDREDSGESYTIVDIVRELLPFQVEEESMEERKSVIDYIRDVLPVLPEEERPPIDDPPPYEACDEGCCGGICGDCGDNEICTFQDGDCPSGYRCESSQCKGEGESCTDNSQCCNENCDGGTCTSGDICRIDGDTCTDNAHCCSSNCDASICTSGDDCRLNGEDCSEHSQCCGQNCDENNTCTIEDICRSDGDSCIENSQCRRKHLRRANRHNFYRAGS